MQVRYFFYIILLIFALTDKVEAQEYPVEEKEKFISDSLSSSYDDGYNFLRSTSLYDDDRFNFRFYFHPFFKNTEYFGDFVKGYTLIGFHFQPEISYSINSFLKVQLMWNLLKYSGYDKYTENKVYPRIVFAPTESFKIICGYLEGNLKHNLIEPIYNPDRYYTDNVENGLQFLLHKPRYNGDMWLNWEKFILWGDPWQERLTFGHRSELFFVKREQFLASFLGELLIAHRGGQIDNSPGQVQSLENGALGFKIDRLGNSDQKFRQFSFQAMFAQFHCIDQTADIPYIDGFGIYAKALLRIGSVGFSQGYWYGDRFMNFRGDPLFTCQAINWENNVRHRTMIFNELFLTKSYCNGLFVLRTGANSYFDPKAGTLEYSYMLSLILKIVNGF